MSTEQEIEQFFTEKGGLPGNSDEERYGTDFISAGVLDSFGLIELIAYIEETFAITLSPEDLQSDQFRTVRGLAAIIARSGS